MKPLDRMTREELIALATGHRRMIHGLQVQLTKALEVIAQNHEKRKTV